MLIEHLCILNEFPDRTYGPAYVIEKINCLHCLNVIAHQSLNVLWVNKSLIHWNLLSLSPLTLGKGTIQPGQVTSSMQG